MVVTPAVTDPVEPQDLVHIHSALRGRVCVQCVHLIKGRLDHEDKKEKLIPCATDLQWTRSLTILVADPQKIRSGLYNDIWVEIWL